MTASTEIGTRRISVRFAVRGVSGAEPPNSMPVPVRLSSLAAFFPSILLVLSPVSSMSVEVEGLYLFPPRHLNGSQVVPVLPDGNACHHEC